MKEEIFGPLPVLDADAYEEIYTMTGLDVDGRREALKRHLPQIEAGIKRYVNFAKLIPGFRDLPVEDQIALVKG